MSFTDHAPADPIKALLENPFEGPPSSKYFKSGGSMDGNPFAAGEEGLRNRKHPNELSVDGDLTPGHSGKDRSVSGGGGDDGDARLVPRVEPASEEEEEDLSDTESRVSAADPRPSTSGAMAPSASQASTRGPKNWKNACLLPLVRSLALLALAVVITVGGMFLFLHLYDTLASGESGLPASANKPDVSSEPNSDGGGGGSATGEWVWWEAFKSAYESLAQSGDGGKRVMVVHSRLGGAEAAAAADMEPDIERCIRLGFIDYTDGEGNSTETEGSRFDTPTFYLERVESDAGAAASIRQHVVGQERCRCAEGHYFAYIDEDVALLKARRGPFCDGRSPTFSQGEKDFLRRKFARLMRAYDAGLAQKAGGQEAVRAREKKNAAIAFVNEIFA